MRRPGEALEAALAERRILVVCGSGGVGKTTTSAALGLRAALGGRKVLVCTIDPSRRLATSLGLSQLSDKPRALDMAKLAPRSSGGMWAMMLDTKRTFDALIGRHAGSEEAKQRILDNRFYREVSAALAGSHEYMAMEKLLELSADPRFDLIVLDTPPTRHALDFLEAPDRMLSFLDASVLRWFLKPYFAAGRLALRVTTKTGAIALRVVDRALGLQFLQDLSEFFLAFEGLYEGFKERASKVFELLRDEDSGFVLVASPSRTTLDEALYFHRRLDEKKMPFVALVVNRMRLDPASAVPRRSGARAVEVEVDELLAAKLLAIHKDQQTVARVDRRSVARLEVDMRETAVLVPELEGDVHDLRGLRDVGDILITGRAPRRTDAAASVAAGESAP